MKRVIIIAIAALTLAACGKAQVLKSYHEGDYQWHKNTLYIKVHWNYERPDKDTIVAEGFVEPFDPKTALHDVDLELVGLDKDGNVVDKAEGRPADNYIASPLGSSPFRIVMKPSGGEDDFTIRGTYYHYIAGTNADFSSRSYDTIPLKADELY